jgi:bacteriocin-like protein
MARNGTNDRNDATVRNLDHAAQNRELTECELDSVSGGTIEISSFSWGSRNPTTVGHTS